MTVRARLAAAAVACLAAGGIFLSVAQPAYAGEFLYGPKYCSPGSVWTSGTGTGVITHYHKAAATGSSKSTVFNHFGTTTTWSWTSHYVNTSVASVAGPGAAYGSISCS